MKVLVRLGILALWLLPRPAAAFDVRLFAKLLDAHTRSVDDTAGTRVDYVALRDDPDWTRLVASLAAAGAPSESASRAERLAFWIDAYNVLAMKLVVEHWPVASIRDVGSLLWPVWKRTAGVVGGRSISLDEIEHRILRPIGDPRIHMAIVCASTSCPSLAREPFEAARLDAQLDAAAARFVADPRKGVRVEAQLVRLSSIFDWFASDFEAGGGVLAFVRRHASMELRAALDRLGPDPSLAYFDYDWSLNGAGAAQRAP